MHSPQYTQKDIGKLLKKSLKNDLFTSLALFSFNNVHEININPIIYYQGAYSGK
jgi:hypothetical protein